MLNSDNGEATKLLKYAIQLCSDYTISLLIQWYTNVHSHQ